MQYSGHPHQKLGHITYSQWGQDLMLLNLCKLLGIDNPSYLDLGAHHPFHISNTALFYQNGFRGINVEPNPYLFSEFVKDRPEDLNINLGISILPGKAQFYMDCEQSTIASLIPSTLIEEHHSQIRKCIEINVTTLNDLIMDYNEGQFPEILLTDIEGLDLSVLSHAQFKIGNRPMIICSEIKRTQGEVAREILLGKGYIQYCRIGGDMIFIITELIDLCL